MGLHAARVAGELGSEFQLEMIELFDGLCEPDLEKLWAEATWLIVLQKLGYRSLYLTGCL